MRNKLITVLALCFVTASPASAIKFCPYTATLAIIGMLEAVRHQAPEYARPLRVVQIAAAGGVVAFTANYFWNQFAAQSPTLDDETNTHETKSHG
jgi:hypothetical protein